MSEKHLLITGRPGSGKTEMLIAIANKHPKTTLFLSEEYDKTTLRDRRGLDRRVNVVTSETFLAETMSKYETLCIDYLELLSDEALEKIVTSIKKGRLHIIVASQVRRGVNEVVERIEALIRRRNDGTKTAI